MRKRSRTDSTRIALLAIADALGDADGRIAALEALRRKDDAQTVRLEHFRPLLQPEYLRAYLKRLPYFDDIEAEDEELDQTKANPDAN